MKKCQNSCVILSLLSFYILGQLLCKDFKIQVLPAAFYLNENVNFKQSAASGKMSTQGCCC